MAQRQFAADSMTPSPIEVSRNEYKDEIPSDRPYHQDVTPGHTNKLYVGRQYSDDWMGGFSAYGKTVDSVAPSKTTQDIQPDNVKRGKES